MKDAMGETTFTIIIIVAAGIIIVALRAILGDANKGILGDIKKKWSGQIGNAQTYNDKEFKIGNYTVTI